MSNPILEGMALKMVHVTCDHYGDEYPSNPDLAGTKKLARAALLWLADNVSDEMVKAATIIWKNDQSSESFEELLKFVISAALRAAAGGGEK